MTGNFVDSCEPGKLNEIGKIGTAYILYIYHYHYISPKWMPVLNVVVSLQANGTSPGSSSMWKAFWTRARQQSSFRYETTTTGSYPLDNIRFLKYLFCPDPGMYQNGEEYRPVPY